MSKKSLTKKALDRLAKLKATWQRGDTPEVRENARTRITEILEKHGYSWSDRDGHFDGNGVYLKGVDDVIKDHLSAIAQATNAAAQSSQPSAPSGVMPIADIVRTTMTVLSQYLKLPRHADLVISLWIAHSYIAHAPRLFRYSPRLAIYSPVPGCGKSRLLDMLELLCQAAEVFDSATAAGIYDFINSGLRTVLLDEGDIMDFRSNGVLSGLYNSGFQQGRKRRVHGQEYNLFAPMAAAMIGSDTLADAGITRTIFVRMTMASGADLDALRHFDPGEQDFFAAFDALKAALSAWAPDAITTLDRNPKMPSELNGRVRDTWRPLVAIADECGPEFAKLIREASLELTKDTPREALPLSLLRDIWKVYDRRRVDRISSVDLVAALRALPEDERRADWTEWRGIKANLDARPLNPNYLAIVP